MRSRFFDFATNFPKLEQFEGVGFRRWQKKMKFLLATLNMAYVLSTPKLEERENETREFSKDIWDTLEAKYIYEDASSKKFLLGVDLRVEEGIRLKESKNEGGAKVTRALGSAVEL
nr:uncharacterized protein LOC109192662 [Ipomoea batatas]GMC84607.1 uncharacterized protein LOC109192662 [Ipomoea batatas]